MSEHQSLDLAIRTVLGESGTPLFYTEITKRIFSRGLRKPTGATPEASVNSHLSNSIKKLGDESPFIRTAPGTYGLQQDQQRRTSELSWKDAIDRVLKESPTPMQSKEIARRIKELGLRANYGKTPDATVGRELSKSIADLGNQSPYIRTAPGTYTLRSKGEVNAPPVTKRKRKTKAQQELFSSFGYRWSKSKVSWEEKELWGKKKGSTPVDFWEQRGIYLLHDRGSVVYVGRSKTNIGERLYSHHKDKQHWDQFSWFGLNPVNGSVLGELDAHQEYDTNSLIEAIEALLIEVVEPKRNNKKGDRLSNKKYRQM